MGRSDLRRRKAYRDPKPRFLIVCEGTVTEKSYLEGMRIAERLLVELHFIGNMKPKQAVERAAVEKKESERKAVRDANQRYDAVWCVFDIDEHPMILEAREQARANGIEVAISNPCFELWIYLHFMDQRAHIHRHKVQSNCRGVLPEYEKRINYDDLRVKRQTAIGRARDLDKWQKDRGKEGANPSTGVYRLVEAILGAAAAS